jgi:TM2 domain-containing membrane protein YozV
MNFVLEILCWIFIFIILIFLAYAWDNQENKRK